MLQIIVASFIILDPLLVLLLFGMAVPFARWRNLRELCHLNEGGTSKTIGYTL
jgi:hypothetical protein